MIDVRQDAVGDERAQLLVVRVEQLVIDDLGEHSVVACQSYQLVELRQMQDRRLFHQEVLAGAKDGFGGLKMARSSGLATQDDVDVLRQAFSTLLRFHADGELSRCALSEDLRGPAPGPEATAAISTSTGPSRGNKGAFDATLPGPGRMFPRTIMPAPTRPTRSFRLPSDCSLGHSWGPADSSPRIAA